MLCGDRNRCTLTIFVSGEKDALRLEDQNDVLGVGSFRQFGLAAQEFVRRVHCLKNVLKQSVE